MRRWGRRLLWMVGSLCVLLAIVAIASVLVVRSAWFQEQVRKRIVTEVERVTGGDVELGSFAFDWSRLRAVLSGFVLHGDEPPDAEPLFRAERIVVGLHVVSMLRRDVDLALIELDQPAFVLERNSDGSTNIPGPERARTSDTGIMERILSLAVREFRVHDGRWRYNRQSGRFDLEGRNLNVEADFVSDGPAYDVGLEWRQLVFRAPQAIPLAMDANLALRVSRNRIEFRRGHLASEGSQADFHGAIDDLDRFAGALDIEARVAIADVQQLRPLPIEPSGVTEFTGSVVWSPETDFRVEGRTRTTGLAVVNRRVDLDNIDATADVVATRETIRVTSLDATTLGGHFRGTATVTGLERFAAEGSLTDLPLGQLMPRVRVPRFAWDGTLSGPVHVSGAFTGPVSGGGEIIIARRSGGLPLEGTVTARFDTAGEDDVVFAESQVSTGSSRIDFSGSLRDGLHVGVYSENVHELLPAMAIWDVAPPDPFPVELGENGVAQFGGLVTGVLDGLRISGHLAAGPVVYKGRVVDEAAVDFDVDRERLNFRSLTLRRGNTRVRGDVSLGLDGWRASGNSPIEGEFSTDGASFHRLLATAGWDRPIDGSVTATGRISGTIASPSVVAGVLARDVTAWDEQIDSVEAGLQYAAGDLLIERGLLHAGGGSLEFLGAYNSRTGDDDPLTGSLTFDVTASDFRLDQWQAVRDFRSDLDAGINGHFQGGIELLDSGPRLESLTGEMTLTSVVLEGRSLGDARLSATTRGNVLVASGSAGLKSAVIRARAEWNLARESVGLGQFNFNDLTLDDLQDLGLFGGPTANIYLEGSMDGEIAFVGPVLRPADWRGMANITRMALTPAHAAESDRDLTLRNVGPMRFSIEPARIAIESARLASADTDLELSGTLSYLRRNPWDLRLNGSIDLAVLTAFRTDLLAEGRSEVDGVIRGSLSEPQINGRLSFENGSFYLRNLPNGIEQVNGAIRFNRTRATIEKFTSRTGGGDLELGGFIGFGGDDWVYRLQANAQHVRVRYPEGVSTVFDANLNLTGSSTRSLLSGDVEVTRMAFSTESDFGDILSQTAAMRPPSEIDNQFLRGMQFDVNITTASNAEFATSLTRDLEIEAELRLRGSVIRPTLLGRVGINRGEIQFFGNRYDIVQGEITFFNPAKIEPVLALDLETRIRSYRVMMNFSGPLDHLNFSYRSDPPLQSEEIMALLTVGRSPSYAGAPTTSAPADQEYFQAGGSSFLGHALTAPVSGRLQRFFGVSRIKIDPQLSGVDNTPETHVTIEQQISRAITLTYVTNLTQTQQQIVRLEWNFHPDWSVFAVRDSNGVFGVDFVYRRRFK